MLYKTFESLMNHKYHDDADKVWNKSKNVYGNYKTQ